MNEITKKTCNKLPFPKEIQQKINIYAYMSMQDINPVLYDFIKNFSYKKYFTFSHKMKIYKKINRARVRYRCLQKVKYFQELKRKRLEKENKKNINNN